MKEIFGEILGKFLASGFSTLSSVDIYTAAVGSLVLYRRFGEWAGNESGFTNGKKELIGS